MKTLYDAVSQAERSGQPVALCIVVKSEGSTPRHLGSKMLVYADGGFIGTVGGGELEHRVIQEALGSIADGKAKLLHYNMSDPARGDPGVCGGQVEVFVEPMLPAPMIVVIGAGHVGKAVAHLAKWLNFHVAVSDDRPEFCTREAVPEADSFHVCAMEDLPSKIRIDSGTFLILTTRGSSLDVAGLPALLRSAAGYVGVIGSRRRWATTVKALELQGVSKGELARVHSPMGLELRAETPEEIALSILAEVLMIRLRASGQSMKEQTKYDGPVADLERDSARQT